MSNREGRDEVQGELNVSNSGGRGLLLQLKLTAALALVVLLKIAH